MTCIHCARMTWYLGVMMFVVAAVAITVFRFWLPALVDRKIEVEDFLTSQIGHSVVIGELAADWQGLYPALHAREIVFKDPEGEKDILLSLDEMSLYLDILPLIQGKFVFREIRLERPVIKVSRSPEGDIYIGKFKAPAPKKGRLALFFQQQKLTISDGQFSWHDHFLHEKEFNINKINFSMENAGRRHLLKGSARLPNTLRDTVTVSFDINGHILEPGTWTGNINTRLSEVNLASLPGILNEKRLLPGMTGTASYDISTEWKKGALEQATGNIKGRDLLIPLGKYGAPFHARGLNADLDLKRKDESWFLTLKNTMIGIAGKPWSAGEIKATHRADESSILIDKIKLADIRPILNALSSENKITQLVKDLYPSGNAHDTSLTLFGPIKKPYDFLYKMSVSEAAVNSYQMYPAATGLRASISVTRTGGSVIAEAKNTRVVIDRVYEKALRFNDLQTTVTWNKGENDWQVETDRLWLKNKDAEAVANFTATIPFDHSLPPLLRLNVELVNGNLLNANRYFPVRLMKPGIRKWFDDAAFRGRLNSAELYYNGTVKGFPVAGAEDFSVEANIESGSLVFAPGWPRLSGVDADLSIGKNDLRVNGTARDLYGQKVEKSHVHISHLAETDNQQVSVNTSLNGDLNNVIKFLQSGPLFQGSVMQEIHLAGKGFGKIKLDVSIPLSNSTNTQVKGEYTTTAAALQLPDESWITSLNGKLEFTERSLSAKDLTGQMLGGPINIAVKTVKQGQPPVVEMTATGNAKASSLGPLLGDWIADELSGSADWQGIMKFDQEQVSLSVNSDLKGLASSFPYPLEKQSSEELPLKLDVSFLDDKKTRLVFSMPAFVNGKLIFTEEKNEMSLTGGCLLIGSNNAKCNDNKGLSVRLESKLLDLDPWDNYIKQQDGDEGLPDVLTRMSASIDSAYYSRVDMADVDAGFDRQKDGSWKGAVKGTRVKGDVKFNWNQSSHWVNMQLAYLNWNEAEGEPLYSSPGQDPKSFPKLNVSIDDLVFHKMKLGKFSMQGGPVDDYWGLDFLKLDRPDMSVLASGRWTGKGKNQVSSFDVDFTSTDMLATLAALDFDIKIESELFRTTGKVSWQGAPYDYELGHLDGQLKVNSEKGRLSSVEVGAGRLLGVLNIESLRRRLLLDFSDLSKEGFAFDEIESVMVIKKGIADVSKLLIPGPSATIRIQGQLGLLEENVDMKMAISPAVGGNLAIAGFVLGGPAGGFVTLLASKAIKEQMNKSSNYQYTIKGLWEDPVVDKIEPVVEGADSGN